MLKDLDLYLIGGQSNAAGATDHNNAFHDEFENVGYAGQVNKSYVSGKADMDNLSAFEDYKWKVTIALGESAARMGPEYGMAEILNPYYAGEKKAFIFKSAAGSTPILGPSKVHLGTWLPRSLWEAGYDPATSGTGIGHQYHSFVENFAKVYKTLQSNGYRPKIKGMAWMQGESDLNESKDYTPYGDALSALIRDLRTDLYEITNDEGVKTMPFVIGKVATSFHIFANPLVPAMNVMQQKVADGTENCETIETADFIMVDAEGNIKGSNAYHYNCYDSRTLGHRFAWKLLEMNNMSRL